MAKVGAQRAAELTGKSKSTIQRAMNSGKLSFELDSNGRRMIDVSELERVFGLQQQDTGGGASVGGASAEAELEKAANMLEVERLKMRIKMLEDKLDVTEGQLDDLRAQRDQWQKQAAQMLITSQYSQKQAEDMREELKERERRARERRQQAEQKMAEKSQQKKDVQRKELEKKMLAMQAENENKILKSGSGTQSSGFNFSGLWKKSRKA